MDRKGRGVDKYREMDKHLTGSFIIDNEKYVFCFVS